MTFPTSLRTLVAEATSGPWHRDGFSMSSIIRKVSDNGSAGEWQRVAECFGNWQNDTPLIVFLANRALAIAELAEAAERFADAYEQTLKSMGVTNGKDATKRLRAALAKLNDTGETK